MYNNSSNRTTKKGTQMQVYNHERRKGVRDTTDIDYFSIIFSMETLFSLLLLSSLLYVAIKCIMYGLDLASPSVSQLVSIQRH